MDPDLTPSFSREFYLSAQESEIVIILNNLIARISIQSTLVNVWWLFEFYFFAKRSTMQNHLDIKF